jgi:hypothetical protein
MLRAMLLMVILKYSKIREFAKELAEKPKLEQIARFEPNQTPATSTFYLYCVSSNGHDLPVHILISQATESDFTLSVKGLDRFIKASRENKLDISIYAVSYDSGHDGLGNYRYLLAKNIHPVIALNPRQGQYPKASGTADKVNKEGIPICIAGVEMRRHTKRPDGRLYFNGPVRNFV